MVAASQMPAPISSFLTVLVDSQHFVKSLTLCTGAEYLSITSKETACGKLVANRQSQCRVGPSLKALAENLAQTSVLYSLLRENRSYSP